MKLLPLFLGCQWAPEGGHTWVMSPVPSNEWQTEKGLGVSKPFSVGVCVSGPL